MTKPLHGSGRYPDHIMISIYSDPSTTMAVTWRTDASTKDGFVLLRKKSETEFTRRIDAVNSPFVSDIDESTMHWAHIDCLASDCEYSYTCGDEQYRSDEYSFRTAPAVIEKFTFLCVSDQQKGEPFEDSDYSAFNKLIKDFLSKFPETAFILTAGDNTDCGQHEQQWNAYFHSGCRGFAESVPLMMALGNHDNRGFADYKTCSGRYYSEPAEFFGNQFRGSYPDNGPEGWKTENYSFDYGDAHFAVIGINEPETVNEWLINNTGSSGKTFKIGAYHFPICYSGANLQNYDAYPVMTEGFEKFNLVFSGHEHNFARSFPLRQESVYERPSEGTVHYTLGNSDLNPPGTSSIPKVWHSAFFPHEEKRSMIAVGMVEGKRLTLTSYLDNGEIVDRCVLDMEKDEILPYAHAPVFAGGRTRMFYKGAYMGLCAMAYPCRETDGVWYAALGVLVNYAGGYVKKSDDTITLSIYGKTATFTCGSDVVLTGSGTVSLPAPVIKPDNSREMYMPVCACELFDMRWRYAKRNNFINFEHESESLPNR